MSLNTLELIFKIFLACILGGIIGLERSSVNRPAGFRTHILVAVGATIVMITNMELVRVMADTAEVQPGRFGASVISGIGFLGAGTIIKEGSSVKGLTTAASLWATACIGIALGSGLYTISLVATAFVFLTLEFLPMLERKLGNRKYSKMRITTLNNVGQLSVISQAYQDLKIKIIGVKTEHDFAKDDKIIIIFKLKYPNDRLRHKIVENITALEGVIAVETDPDSWD